MIRDQLLKALAPREERIEFEGYALLVREIPVAEDLSDFEKNEDSAFRLLVRSVYDEEGNRAFADEDIPALKASSKRKVIELQDAVARVNGWKAEEEVKNSGADQSSG